MGGPSEASHEIDSIGSHTWSQTGTKVGANTRLTITQVDPEWPHDGTGSYDATDITKPGTYVMKYTCEDFSGNQAPPKFRTIVVVDDIKPTLALRPNNNTCEDGHTCYQEAGFKWTDPGVVATDTMQSKYP